MKIVLTDAQTVIDDLVNADPLRALGEVTEHGLLAYEEVAEQIADADVVVCNKTLMDAHTLRYAKKLRYIGLFATGYNNIDIDYCRAHGIAVCNAGSYSTNAVAQHTFALILEAYNRTAQYDRYVHDGLWKRSPTFSPFKIAGAFQMNVIGCNRSPKTVDGVETVSFEELLRRSDIVSVHCPLNAESRDLFNKTTFDSMKQGALFVNTARGGVVVEQDLFDALESGHLGMAAVDQKLHHDAAHRLGAGGNPRAPDGYRGG